MTEISAADAAVPVVLAVNGTEHRVAVEPRKTLADALREDCGLTGTHLGCEHGVCGACTVLIDGRPARSCLAFAVQCEGAEVVTVEGLEEGALHAAFRRHFALQCGFCTAGILMSLTAFLRENPDPTEREVREVLSGHLCRCTGYTPIVAAALDAADA